MTLPSSARLRTAYVAESVPGTTPATPTFLMLRVTQAGLRTEKTTRAVQEIVSDLNLRSEVQTFQKASATYNFALSYASFDDILQYSLYSGAWQTNVITNGTTETTFTIEETADIGGGSFLYDRATNCIIDHLTLDISAQQEVTGSFSVFGMKEVLDTAIISGSTYTAPNNKQVMAAGAGVASLSVLSLATPKVRKVSLDVKNNLRDRPVVDSLYTSSFGRGLTDITGTIDAYFDANTTYQKVLDHGIGALSFTVGTVTAEKYTFSMPQCQFLNGARQVGGTGNDIMISIPFRAVFDTGISGSIRITRAVA